MKKLITIYHGSDKVIESPSFGEGRKNNDFGLGFYCTESNDLAKEWGVSSLSDGFSNRYKLDTDNLNILRLNSKDYTILNWMAVLVEHRLFSLDTPGARRAKQYLISKFGINVNAYDVIIGYRADDSYYNYAEAFLYNSITIDQLSRAMKLGKLGEQVVIKSRIGFSRIHYEGYEEAKRSQYYPLKKSRNDEANQKYQNILEEEIDSLYIQDIIRGDISNDDPRIPRNIS